MTKTAEELEKELNEERAKNAENIKALQQKLTEKDVEAKKVLAEIEELKKKGSGDSEAVGQIKALTETVKTMTNEINTINTDKRKEELRKKFPEVMPELLLGKSDEEAEIIVNKQKELNLQNYDSRPLSHAPIYKDKNAVDEEINRVKEDKTLETEDKFIKIGELKKKRDAL